MPLPSYNSSNDENPDHATAELSFFHWWQNFNRCAPTWQLYYNQGIIILPVKRWQHFDERRLHYTDTKIMPLQNYHSSIGYNTFIDVYWTEELSFYHPDTYFFFKFTSLSLTVRLKLPIEDKMESR